jgi:hypothetical protein
VAQDSRGPALPETDTVPAPIPVRVPVWFIETKVSDGQGHRLCLTDEGAGEPIELQVCDANRSGQKWWIQETDEGRWFIGSALDQGYVLTVPLGVAVGHEFSLKRLSFTNKTQNWREEYDDSQSNPTIYWQWNDSYVMQVASRRAGSRLVVARLRDPRQGPDPDQGFMIHALPQ